ncbi:MAG: oligoendopeptidase F family protein [Firmicutes bacterium]|nr:oligoendopeptidase F family protein [Bacillota bacterium]
MNYNYNNRAEVPEIYCWDLTERFKNCEDWRKELAEAKKHINDLNIYKGKIFSNGNLYELLDKFYIYSNKLLKLYQYANLLHDTDLANEDYSKMCNEVLNLYAIFNQNISFMMPEILHSNNFDIDLLIKKDNRLKRFKHVLEEFALEKKYIKDIETEKIIAILTKDMDSYEELANKLLSSNIDYGKIKDENGNIVGLNTSNYHHFTSSNNRNVRKNAYYKFNKKKSEFLNILGDNLLAFMNRHASISKIRGYKSTKEMDFANEYIPIEIHDSLLENSKRGLDLFRKYYKIRKKILGLNKLKPYDLGAPIVKNNRKYTVEEAQEYFINATKILGEDYTSYVMLGFDKHWIDYMGYKGKMSGAYCSSVYDNNPNILMSFNGRFDNISTIAHEMGHAINKKYSYPNNTIEYAGYNLYTCEIASLLNEILLASYVIENDFSKEEKIEVINEMLRTINANFFTAIMENELENIVYEKIDDGEILNTDDLNSIMASLTDKYYGDVLDKGIYFNNMWASRNHYFTPWYLYKYATCICGAVYFASKILKGDKEVLNQYKEFLKTGNDRFPNEILLDFGIDLTNPKIYDELFEYYVSLLNKLQELTEVGEI